MQIRRLDARPRRHRPSRAGAIDVRTLPARPVSRTKAGSLRVRLEAASAAPLTPQDLLNGQTLIVGDANKPTTFVLAGAGIVGLLARRRSITARRDRPGPDVP